MNFFGSVLILLIHLHSVIACDGCYGPQNDVVLTRHVRRMQPEAQNSTNGPRAPLEWGQINFLQTTDTHGWLEGHLKEQNYGADWGDFVSFIKKMKQKACDLGVDLLLIDTGDLHDGNGLSDATSPNGLITNPIFENIDYDILTIGNHELYVSEISYEHFNQFAKVFGDRYVTSNVKILNPSTGKFEYIGVPYRYFTTEQGLRIMAFGVLFDFTGNSNVSRVTKTADLIKEQWFLDAIATPQPIDLFVVAGHNPVRTNASTSTYGTIYQTIRGLRPDTPIQFFGGHTHIRDFFVYDNKATGLEAGRYCETVGWLSMTGIRSSNYKAPKLPQGVPTPTRGAIFVATDKTAANLSLSTSPSSLLYSRRYLDWNRLTFEYHAQTSQDHTFDTQNGKAVSAIISAGRKQLNLSTLYGCAPRTYCQYCKPFGDPGNIYTLIPTALAATVVNQSRADVPRLIIVHIGHIRFDLVQGPFTFDDSFIVSPFRNAFQFISDVPYDMASKVLGILNAGKPQKRDLSTEDFAFGAASTIDQQSCIDPPITHDHLSRRFYSGGRLLRRQSTLAPGYITTDDFGDDGDDTPHTFIPTYKQPNDIQAIVSFPIDGSMPAAVDLVFLDFIAPNILNALNGLGGRYSKSDVSYYLPTEFTTNSYFAEYAKMAWQANMPKCPVGAGVGS